jgi:hypothetical protein
MSAMDDVRRAAQKVRTAEERLEKARGDLNRAIVAARAEGGTLRGIAKVAGLSYARIFQISEKGG